MRLMARCDFKTVTASCTLPPVVISFSDEALVINLPFGCELEIQFVRYNKYLDLTRRGCVVQLVPLFCWSGETCLLWCMPQSPRCETDLPCHVTAISVECGIRGVGRVA